VIDLRSGANQRVGDLFGDTAGTRISRQGRSAFSVVRDSLVHGEARMTDARRRAAAAIVSAQFDDKSFSLSDMDGSPTVTFTIPGRGEGRAGDGVELDPITGSPAPWWTDVRDGRPSTDAEGTDRWTRSGYTVVARYDSAGEIASLSLTDSTRREWPLMSITAPLHRIDWLDRPPISAAERRELTEAFNAAALYDEGARVALRPAPRPTLLFASANALHSASLLPRFRLQDGSRKPARDIRAHDARARE
jgi:hypothetical protein